MKVVAAVVSLAAPMVALAGFQVDRSVMSDEYWAIWNDGVQAKIDADIEKNRKADASFEVSAPDGAEVSVDQLSHEFRFGAHIFNFNQLGKKEYNDAYKASYGDGGLFNQATTPSLARRQWIIRSGGAPRRGRSSTSSSRRKCASTATS